MRAQQVDEMMRALAERQHGVVSRAQARSVGANRQILRRRIESRTWEPLSDQVVRLVGAPSSYRQRCMAAALDAGAGAVVSGLAAAHLWGFPGFPAGPVEASQPGRGHHRASVLAVVHHSRFLPERHRILVDGVPVTTVARTVFDLAGKLHPGRTERTLDNVLAHRLVSLETLRLVTIELLARGRKGSATMRMLLQDRGAGYIPPASGLEARFLALLIEAGIELPDRQVDIGGDDWIGRVDFLYRRQRLVVEIDSDRHHTSKLDREADARRDAAMRAAGYTVLRFDEHQLRSRPGAVLASVRAALRHAA